MNSFYRIFPFIIVLPAGFLFPAAGQPPYDNYHLVWSDEFDVSGLPDSKNWGYEKGCSVRNSELQYYAEAREKNSRVEDGFLIIEAHRETMSGCTYTSANLRTMGKRSFKYGLFEIRAKIDIRQGSWPAWWWLPNSGGWPRGGEIDMMEFYQGKCLFNVMDGNQKWSSKTKRVSSEWAERFHVWTWEWDSLKIDLWLDDTLMNHYPVENADGTGPNGENPFRRPGYMLVNQAIGGTNGGDPSKTEFPIQYIIDYVRHYQQGGDTSGVKSDSSPMIYFNGKRVLHRNGTSLLSPPLAVTVYTINGRSAEKWAISGNDGPMSLSRILDRAGRCSTVSQQLRIVTIREVNGQLLRFTTITRK
ncbi:MAG: glycoside hydrolase family 16 protein [Chitinispirillaceae bacterium]|nr:glycoside hydrolase family 16 protein [Chitinispirillaceae bacterium]